MAFVSRCAQLVSAGTISVMAAHKTGTPVSAHGSDGDRVVARLVAALYTAEVDDDVLDETVHDICDRSASRRFNNDETLTDMDDTEAHDLIHDEAGRVASEINNSGFVTQVAFLIAELGIDATVDLINSATSRRP